jgi:bacillithiol system protein YtxJ
MWNPFSAESLPKAWAELKNVGQLDQAKEESFNQPVVLFKHSTRCSRSMFAKSKLEEDYNIPNEELKFYYLDLLNHRDISDAIASKFGVHHQSPQIVLLKDGKVTFHTSHEQISLSKLKQHI